MANGNTLLFRRHALDERSTGGKEGGRTRAGAIGYRKIEETRKSELICSQLGSLLAKRGCQGFLATGTVKMIAHQGRSTQEVALGERI